MNSADSPWVARQTIAPDLWFVELRKSDGRLVRGGDRVRIHYQIAVGRQEIEKPEWVFSSWEAEEPLIATIGAGELLKGVDRVLDGMRIAGERRVWMGPDWAFGSREVGTTIPPNAWLTTQIYVAGMVT